MTTHPIRPTDQLPVWFGQATNVLRAAIRDDHAAAKMHLQGIVFDHGPDVIPEVVQSFVDSTLGHVYGITDYGSGAGVQLTFEAGADVPEVVWAANVIKVWAANVIKARAEDDEQTWLRLLGEAGTDEHAWSRHVWALTCVCASAFKHRDELEPVRLRNACVQARRSACDATAFVSINGGQLELKPIDPRDTSPDDGHLLDPHGPQAAYMIAVVDQEDRAAGGVEIHKSLEQLALETGRDLCPVRHLEEVQPDQLPHTARSGVLLALDQANQEGHTGIILRGWRHIGTACPEPRADA